MTMLAMSVTEAGRRGGLRGGPARNAHLTPERRSEIARLGAKARWGNRELLSKNKAKGAYARWNKSETKKGESMQELTQTLEKLRATHLEFKNKTAQIAAALEAFEKLVADLNGNVSENKSDLDFSAAPTWECSLAALKALGGQANSREISNYLIKNGWKTFSSDPKPVVYASVYQYLYRERGLVEPLGNGLWKLK